MTPIKSLSRKEARDMIKNAIRVWHCEKTGDGGVVPVSKGKIIARGVKCPYCKTVNVFRGDIEIIFCNKCGKRYTDDGVQR